MGEGESRRLKKPVEPLRPVNHIDKPWPTPIPTVPIPDRQDQDRMLKQIIDKLIEIEKRLENIEKALKIIPK
jgi:hypothetical protein